VSGCWRRPRSTGWLTGAAAGARGPNRVNHRDGYRGRGRGTRVGRVELATPEPRQGACCPTLLEPRRTAGKALTAVIQEACAHGTSTRAVGDPVEAMGGTGVSKSQVRRLRAGIDGRGRASLARPIEGAWPYLRIDATYPRSRNGGRVAGVAVMIAVAVDSDGRRELGSGAPEGRGHRCPRGRGVLDPERHRRPARARWPTAAGARGVKLAVAAGHEGPPGRPPAASPTPAISAAAGIGPATSWRMPRHSSAPRWRP
jgi:hypothetical protein